MRYIHKSNEPPEFTAWKALENYDWKPSYSLLSGSVKQSVYNSLLKEQGYICCYCERELLENDYHIDHLNPQFLHAGDDLNYSNFLCSCLNKTVRGNPLHCGVLKADDTIDIHPLVHDCAEQFEYTYDGLIGGVNEKANETIKTIGLDIKKLNDLRKKAIAPFLDPEIEGDFSDFVHGYLQPNSGKLNPFVTTIKFLFGANI